MGEFWSNLLSLGIILVLAFIFYLKFTKQTFKEFFQGMKELNSPPEVKNVWRNWNNRRKRK